MRCRNYWRYGAATVSILALMPAVAQDYPTKPITLVVPYGTGGGTDVTARLIGGEMAKHLNQGVVVDNRTGAGGAVGGAATARAKPDGYTMCFCGVGPSVMLQFLNPKLQYKPETDLLPVGQVGDLQLVLVVRADSPFHTLGDIIAASKTKSLTYGHSGAGTSLHLAGELLRIRTKGDFVAVPYKSGPASMTDLIGGQIDMAYTALTPAIPLVEAKRIRIIAVANERRVASLPNTPTFAESGVPGYGVSAFYGISVPAGTPPAIVNKLSAALMASIRDPAVNAKLESQGVSAVGSTPVEYKRFIDNQFRVLGPLIQELKLTAD